MCAAERVLEAFQERRVIDAADRVKCGTQKSAVAHTVAQGGIKILSKLVKNR